MAQTTWIPAPHPVSFSFSMQKPENALVWLSSLKSRSPNSFNEPRAVNDGLNLMSPNAQKIMRRLEGHLSILTNVNWKWTWRTFSVAVLCIESLISAYTKISPDAESVELADERKGGISPLLDLLKKNPKASTMLGGNIALGAMSLLANNDIMEAAGFGENGIIKDSPLAILQSEIFGGSVAKGSPFANLQRLGARRNSAMSAEESFRFTLNLAGEVLKILQETSKEKCQGATGSALGCSGKITDFEGLTSDPRLTHTILQAWKEERRQLGVNMVVAICAASLVMMTAVLFIRAFARNA